jgi:cytidylate kinase
MQIICISSGIAQESKRLAEGVAQKLGYPVLCRETLLEEAIKEGIQVGKLETSVIKPRIFTDRLALEREYYKAFITSTLCRTAMKGGLVYCGRTGHLLFSGIGHVLKVRIVEDESARLEYVMEKLNLNHAKARRYIEAVDEDRKRWGISMYGISPEEPSHYDVVLNLGSISTANAAAAVVNIAQLPDFQLTPASKRAVEDLMLASQARLLLARDKRTFRANIKVRADKGLVTVTYLPQDAGMENVIGEVLSPLKDLHEVRTTMASTNILWIQEAFEASSETFTQVAEIASKWNSAVELLQYKPGSGPENGLGESVNPEAEPRIASISGGIEEDEGEPVCEDRGMKMAQDELARLGLSGGGRVICGEGEQIVKSIDRTVPYSLVVVGDVFLGKGHSARLRLGRQLIGYLSGHIRAPVVNADELKTQYLFSRRDLIGIMEHVGAVGFLLFLVFTYQEPIIRFMSNGDLKFKILASAGVFLFSPIFAYLHGNVAKSVMKLIRME